MALLGSYKVAISPDLSSFNKVASSIRGSLTSAAQGSESAFTSVAKSAGKIGDAATSSLRSASKAADSFASKMAKAGSVYSKGLAGSVSIATGTIGSIGSAAAKSFSIIGRGASTAFGGAVKAASGIGSALSAATKVSFAPVEAGLNGLVSTAAKVGSAIQSTLTAAAVSAGGAIASALPDAINQSDALDDFRSEMEFTAQQGITNLTDADITQLQKQMTAFAGATEYDLNDMIDSVGAFAANGVRNYEQLAEHAAQFNSAAGGTAQTFHQMVYVLKQIAAQGKVMTGDWYQIANAVPGGIGALRKQLEEMGAYAGGDLKKALSTGAISSDELFEALNRLGSSKIAEQAAKSSTTIRGAWANTSADFVTAISQIVTANKSLVTDFINGGLRDAGLGAINILSQMVDLFKDFAAGGSKIDGTLAKINASIQNGLEKRLNKALQSMRNILPRLNTVAQGFARIGSSILSAFADVAPQIGSILADAIIDLGNLAAMMVPSILKLINSIMATISAQAPRILSSLSRIIQQQAPGIIATIGNVITTIATTIYDNADAFYNAFATIISSITSTIAADLPRIVRSITSAIQRIVPQLGKLITRIAATLIKTMSSMIPELVSAASTIVNAIIDAAGAIIPSLAGLITEATVAIAAAIPGIVSNLTSTIDRIIPTIVNDAKIMINAIGDALSASLPEVLSTASGIFSAIVDVIVDGLTTLASIVSDHAGEIMDAMVGAFETLASAIPKALPSLLDAASKMIGEFFKALPGIVESVFSDVNAILDGVFKIIDQVVAGVSSYLQAHGKDLAKNIESVFGSVVSEIIKVADKLAPQILVFITQLNAAFLEQLPKLGAQLSQALLTLIPLIGQAITTMLTDLADTLSQNASAAGHTIADILESIVKAAVPIFEVIFTKLIPALGKVVASTFQAIFTNGFSGVDTGSAVDNIDFVSMGNNIGQKIGDALSGIGQWLVDGLVSATRWLAKNGGAVVDGLLAAIDEIWNRVIGLIQKNFENGGFQKISENIMSFLQDSLPDIAEEAGKIVGSLLALLIQNLPQIVQNAFSQQQQILELIPQIVWGIINGIFEGASGGIPLDQAFGTIWNSIADGFTNAWTTVSSKFDSVKDELGSKLEDMKSTVSDKYNQIQDIQQGFSDGFSKTNGSFLEKLNGGVIGVAEKMGLSRDQVLNIEQQLVDGIKNEMNDLGKNFSNFWNNLANKAKGFGSAVMRNIRAGFVSGWNAIRDFFVNLGKDIWNGIQAGIEGMKNGIRNTASWIKDSLGGGLRKAFGIGSPSKVMAAEIGRWIPAGIGVGIEKYSDPLLTQAASLASTLTNTLSINPTATWSLEDSATAQSQQIAAMKTSLAATSYDGFGYQYSQQPQIVINQQVDRADSLADVYNQTRLAASGYFSRTIVPAKTK